MKNWNFISGWSLKTARVSRAVLPGLLMMFPVQLMVIETCKAGGNTVDIEQLPSIEFLEYLGSGVKVEDEFLDPLNYTEIETGASGDESQNTASSKTQQNDE